MYSVTVENLRIAVPGGDKMNRLVFLAVVVSAMACSGISSTEDASSVLPDGSQVDTPAADVVLLPDYRSTDLTGDIAVDFGQGQDSGEPLPQCDPGDGCFLDKCTENSDCQSGWCVDHMGEGVCSKFCNDDCPAGWSCKMVASTALDVVYICVSDHATLCRPCNATLDCAGTAGEEDVCVSYGAEGAFCGSQCGVEAGQECPWGFTCQSVQTVEDVDVNQCVADSGTCPCTSKSVALALWTACGVDNEFGQCSGKRICTADGLTDCDAVEAGQELCNGVDDDCDGEVDEPPLFEGEYSNICDDGYGCTEDACKGEEGCLHEDVTGGECMDGDPCTAGDHCDAGVCQGNPIVCDDENPCTDDSCDGLGGCQFANNMANCDDEDPCSVADQCQAGQCAGTPVDCECQTDEDCLPYDDGDLCTGVLECNKDALPYRCSLVPGSKVVCAQPEGTDAICNKASCQPDTGACGFAPHNQGFACEDGDQCTFGEACADGVCAEGFALNCQDDNVCTDDFCDPQQGCQNSFNEATCSDGDVCTTVDACAGGQCGGGAPLECDDENVCTQDSCQGAVGCVHQPQDGQCDDGNSCTDGDHCFGGKCVGILALDCDDGDVCTTDSCLPLGGCVHTLNQAPCDDGDLCTVGDHCHLGDCIASSNLACNDGNQCTDDSCQPAIGCVQLPNNLACDDGNLCTTGDQCVNGWCASLGSMDCDDGDICTDDSCAPGVGCQYGHNDAPCSDSDACTSGEICSAGQCGGGKPVNCNDGNVCTDEACEPDVGCVYAHNGGPCDDGNVCSTGDACLDGLCQSSGSLVCDDGNLCTADDCQPDSGCVFLAEGSACDDDNVCTLDLCDPATGECAHAFVPDQTPCDDGKECTDPDLCLMGLCTGDGPAVCPRDIYVDINSPQQLEDGTLWYPWKSIAMGLADAKPGDNVWVFPGTYDEVLAMPSGVKLRSLAGASQTFIRRNGSGGITLIDCKGCSAETLIEGFLLEAGTGNGQSYCIQIWDSSSPTIRNNVLLAHHWQAYAIVISGSESKPRIINNTVKGWDGGADTVSIVISSGYPTVKNNIFIGDATSGNKNSLGIDANNGHFPEENNYNYYYKMTAATDGCSVGEGGIFDNGAAPLFVDEDGLDYHLAPGSPGIDSGDPDEMYNDKDGTRNDMGAFGGPYAVVDYVPPVPSEPFPDPLPPDTVYVDISNETGIEDGTPEHPFDTILEGITWAGPGDMVRVASGVYNEVVKMKSGIKLIGENPANTVIDGQGLGEEFWSENPTILVWVSENSTLAGFRLLNSDYYGVYCKNVAGVEMRNMIIADIPHTGFRYDTCEATLINNTFVNCGYAALTAGNMNNTSVEMNNIFANGGSIYEVPPQSSYNTYFNSGFYSGGGEGDITSDPKFVDADNGDYRLQVGSPAMDAGNPDPVHNDSDGSRNDMGAFGGPTL